MVVAVIPIKGRRLLIPYTIQRAKRICDEVVCVTSHKSEMDLCRSAGALVTNGFKMALGRKWNGGFQYARSLDPDYILYIGSSDWLSDNWLEIMLPLMGDNDFIGKSDYYELHLEFDIPFLRGEEYDIEEVRRSFRRRMFGHWKGYTDERAGEPIGIGRILSRSFLERIDWKPFDDGQVKNMDHTMTKKAIKYASISDDRAKCLSISTTLWANMHDFWLDMSNPGSEIIHNEHILKTYFPEALCLF